MSSYITFSPHLHPSLTQLHPNCVKYLRIYSKSVVLQNHIAFLSTSIRNKVVPKGFKMTFNPVHMFPFETSVSSAISSSLLLCSLSIMNIILNYYYSLLPSLVSQTFTLLTELSALLSSQNFVRLLSLQTVWTQSLESKLETVKERKLNGLDCLLSVSPAQNCFSTHNLLQTPSNYESLIHELSPIPPLPLNFLNAEQSHSETGVFNNISSSKNKLAVSKITPKRLPSSTSPKRLHSTTSPKHIFIDQSSSHSVSSQDLHGISTNNTTLQALLACPLPFSQSPDFLSHPSHTLLNLCLI